MSDDVQRAVSYRVGSRVFGPFGSKFADDEHSSICLLLKCAHDIASKSLYCKE